MEYTWKDWELFDHVVVLFELDMNILDSLCSFCAVWSIYKHIRVSLISLFMQFEVYINILESLWSHCLCSLKYILTYWSLFDLIVCIVWSIHWMIGVSFLGSLKYILTDWSRCCAVWSIHWMIGMSLISLFGQYWSIH